MGQHSRSRIGAGEEALRYAPHTSSVSERDTIARSPRFPRSARIARLATVPLRRSSVLTQERVGWRPEGPGLIADIEQGHYFKKDVLSQQGGQTIGRNAND